MIRNKYICKNCQAEISRIEKTSKVWRLVDGKPQHLCDTKESGVTEWHEAEKVEVSQSKVESARTRANKPTPVDNSKFWVVLQEDHTYIYGGKHSDSFDDAQSTSGTAATKTKRRFYVLEAVGVCGVSNPVIQWTDINSATK